MKTHVPLTCTQLFAFTYVAPFNVPSGTTRFPCRPSVHHETTSLSICDIDVEVLDKGEGGPKRQKSVCETR